MDTKFQRGLFLYQSGRHRDAAKELREAIAADPTDAHQHAFLALCLIEIEKLQEAVTEARTAVSLGPEDSFVYSVLARVLLSQEETKAALQAAQEALRIDPEESAYYGLLARIYFLQSRWSDVIETTDKGLVLDADDDTCLHFRALALTKLGRQDEAKSALDRLMTLDPEDAYTHCGKGWNSLEFGRREEAQKHFREALRIDPQNADAREGFVLTLKAKHPFYFLLLRSFLWLGRFRATGQWIIVIGVILLIRFADAWSLRHPDWAIAVVCLKAAFYTVSIASIISNPLFNLLLRSDPEGRLALTEDQIKASNWNALLMFLALCLAFWWSIFNFKLAPPMAIGLLGLTGAVSETFDARSIWVRVRMKWITWLLAALLCLAFVAIFAVTILAIRYKPFRPHLKTAVLACIYVQCFIGLAGLFADNIREFLEKRRPDDSSL